MSSEDRIKRGRFLHQSSHTYIHVYHITEQMLLLFTVKTPISQHDEPFSLKKKKTKPKIKYYIRSYMHLIF